MLSLVISHGIRFLLSHRWTFFAIAGLFIVLGGTSFITAHPTQPVAIHGSIASYDEYTRNGVYNHSQMVLNEDASHTYSYNESDFHPNMPDFDHIYRNGSVTLWINAGTTDVIAVELSDQHNKNPVRYTTTYFDNPNKADQDGIVTGSVLSVISLAFWLMGLFWWKMPWTKSARLYSPVILPKLSKN